MSNSLKRVFALALVVSLLAALMVSCSGTPIAKGKLREQARWLEGLTAESVVKVDIKCTAYSVAPGTINSCYYTQDKDVIAKIIEIYQNMEIKMDTPDKVNDLVGGSSRSITFTFTDGHTEELYFLHGYYKSGMFVYDIVCGDDKDYYNDCEQYLRFSNYSNEDDVYSCADEPAIIGKATGIETWEFIYINAPENVDPQKDALFYIEASFGRIYFFDETRFCVAQSEETTYYELTNGQTVSDFVILNTVNQ